MMNPRTTLTADRLMAHTGWVRRLARTLVRDPAAADDLAHDALLVALDRPPEVREGIRSWFGRVLTNRLRMDARASRRRAAREQAVMGLVAVSSTPEEVAQRLELQRRLAEAMLSLGEIYRQVLFLRFFEERSPAEIAQQLGVPAGTIRWRLKTGLDELRARLAAEPDPHRLRALLLAVGGPKEEGPRRAPPAPVSRGSGYWIVATLGGAALIAGVAIFARRSADATGVAPAAQGAVAPAVSADRGSGVDQGRRPPRFVLAANGAATVDRDAGAGRDGAATARRKKPPGRSPFTGVRWPSDTPQVLMDGKWSELRGVAGLPVARVVAFAKQRYAPDDFPPLWRKRFSEDLVEVLTAMGVPPGERIDVEVKDLDTGAVSRRSAVPMTADNRQQVWQLNNRAPFDHLRLHGHVPEVSVEGVWYELISIEGIPSSKTVALCEAAQKPEDTEKRLAACCALTVVDALSMLGRVPGDTVDLGLRDLGTGATLHKQMPLGPRPWARMVREMVPALQTP
jgi:RNA polymerase sigma-70 factor (ECF subfamily)